MGLRFVIGEVGFFLVVDWVSYVFLDEGKFNRMGRVVSKKYVFVFRIIEIIEF